MNRAPNPFQFVDGLPYGRSESFDLVSRRRHCLIGWVLRRHA
jgi:hypothetical protein